MAFTLDQARAYLASYAAIKAARRSHADLISEYDAVLLIGARMALEARDTVDRADGGNVVALRPKGNVRTRSA